MLWNILFLANHICSETGVKEEKVEGFNYEQLKYNDHIDLTNVIVKPDKLIMRSSVEESSMIRWDIPNKADDWSFEVEFNEPNLNSNEKTTLYMFYTKEKPFIGSFKGSASIFHGFAAGIEMQGKAFELGYSRNDGKDYHNLDHSYIIMDSLNPRRFKNSKTLKMKIISTNKNFKVELSEDGKIIYDNFKILNENDLKFNKKGLYLGLFASYDNVSSGKALEITNAQFFTRKETSEYDVDKSYMIRTIPTALKKSEIQHSDIDVKEFIFKSYKVFKDTQHLLGVLPNSTISEVEEEMLKEIEHLHTRSKKLSEALDLKNNNLKSPRNLNEIEQKIQSLQKSTLEIGFLIDQISDIKTQKNEIYGYATLFFGLFLAGILLIGEIINMMDTKKTSKIN